jgi:hypothetical protein
LIVVIIPKGQINLSCSWSVTIANPDFSFVEMTIRVVDGPPLKGARGMTNGNYRTIIPAKVIA